MTENIKLICTVRRKAGLVADLNTYANRGDLVRRCNDYKPARGKSNLSPSCLWCIHSDIEV